ncbi:seminal metalloprotease 1-like [Pectinophora gossypiella]|uniref:seminal metalloprotease 1-like n=1 Tax=Pectinophora gossypiella TaxID=13191 RepID=UPI00214F28E7|nr:seminal metalloprotease 1-like [Pectinophora gossypiella]
MMLIVLWAVLVVANGAPVIEEQNLIEAMKEFRNENVYWALLIPVSEKQNHKGEEDFENADVGEFGNYFEGDMILTEEQQETLARGDNDRNGLVNVTKRWPERTLVYYIETDDLDDEQVKMIHLAMEDIANKSCVRFRPRVDNEHAVIIQGSQNGCFSSVGFTSSDDDDADSNASQILNLANGCFRHGTIVHELLHALGFYHMQSTFNRDEYVKVLWKNIRPGYEHNFAKYTSEAVTNFGVPYDFSSVLHYPATAFSSNGKPTIIPLQDDVKIGQRDGMSESDVLKLNKMYCEVRADYEN